MYIVIEIQKNEETISTLVDSYADINDAKSKYHSILAYAAKSDLDKHAASVLDDNGRCIFHECYTKTAAE